MSTHTVETSVAADPQLGQRMSELELLYQHAPL